VLHLELSIRHSHMAYEPGDSIGVLPANPPELVANTCKRLGVNPSRVFYTAPAVT
jgi:NADPH-ferrihemoprotein reductase